LAGQGLLPGARLPEPLELHALRFREEFQGTVLEFLLQQVKRPAFAWESRVAKANAE
jgi:hypothetical protein